MANLEPLCLSERRKQKCPMLSSPTCRHLHGSHARNRQARHGDGGSQHGVEFASRIRSTYRAWPRPAVASKSSQRLASMYRASSSDKWGRPVTTPWSSSLRHAPGRPILCCRRVQVIGTTILDRCRHKHLVSSLVSAAMDRDPDVAVAVPDCHWNCPVRPPRPQHGRPDRPSKCPYLPTLLPWVPGSK